MPSFSEIRLLVVTRHSPLPENDGAGAYLFDLLAYAAARGVTIEVAWFDPPGEWIRRGWCRVPAHLHRVCSLQMPGALAVGRWRFFWWGAVKARVLHAIKTVLQALRLYPSPPRTGADLPRPIPLAPSWVSLPSAAERRFSTQRTARFTPTALLANYCWLTPCFDGLALANTSVLAHDIISERLAQLHPELSGPAGELAPNSIEGEGCLLGKARVVLAISAADAGFFRQRLQHPRVLVVPKAVCIASTTPARACAKRCLFVGGANEPNRTGLAWFISVVWPLVRVAHPNATLHVCGAVCESVVSPAAGMTLQGRVPDLAPHYQAAELVVVPLLAGTGVKIKLVEAASHGKACVTTGVGLQGLDFLRPVVACADDAPAFAARVHDLLSDAGLRRALGSGARRAVAEHLSPDSCYRHFLETIAENLDRRASN